MKDIDLESVWERVKKGQIDDSNKEVIDFIKSKDSNTTHTTAKKENVQTDH